MLEGLSVKISIIKFSETFSNSDFRIDAEYYDPFSIDVHNKILQKNGVNFFSKIQKISSGKNLPQVDSGKFSFVRTQNVRPVLIDDSGMSFVDDLGSLKPTKKGDLLFVRVGEGVGNSSVVTQKYSGQAFSDNVLRLEIKDLNPFFCSVFFNSRVGQLYFKRVFKGTARSLISQENFKEILIPIFGDHFQSLIQKLVEDAQNFLEESQGIYTQAEALLLKSLGLENFSPSNKNTGIKSFKDSFTATSRLDAEYYQPKYEDYQNHIFSYSEGWLPLGKVCDLKDKNYSPSDEKFYQYIELADIDKSGGVKGCSKELGKDLPSRARRKVNAEDVLISSIEGSLSSCAIVCKEFGDSLCSTGFYVIKSDKISSETLLVLFKSDLMQNILKQSCSGTILTAINKDEFLKIPLPLIDQKNQSQISSLVQESFTLKSKSEKLLEVAKQAIEMAIEESEEAAIKFINHNNLSR